MPAPGATCTMLDNLITATRMPSRQTSIMLHGRNATQHAHGLRETRRAPSAPGMDQHPTQQGDLQEGHDDHGQGGGQRDRCGGAMCQRGGSLPQRGFVVQPLQADADDGADVGDHEHDRSGDGQGQPTVYVQLLAR